MKKINRIFLRIIAVCFISCIPFTNVWSADEDMISQVYLEFDPETGEFVTAQDPNLTGTSKHSLAQSKQVEQIQQAQDALATDQTADAKTMAATPAAGQQSMGTNEMGGGSNSTMLIAGVVALGLLIGIVAFIRKGQKTP
jgi:hypothetical protein